METEETRQLVLRFLDARSANDTEAMAALLTEDATGYPPKSAGFGPFEGRDAAVAALGGGAIGKVLDVSTMKRMVHKVIADGDTAVAVQRLQGHRHQDRRRVRQRVRLGLHLPRRQDLPARRVRRHPSRRAGIRLGQELSPGSTGWVRG